MTHLEQPLPVEIAGDPRWMTVDRIADSQCFHRSARLRDFLLYVAEQQLSGHPEEITEQYIGHRVYGRRENYSPMEDNIVRVSARQLRAKLREFYETEGKDEPWIVEIPKGGYTPLFLKRETPQPPAAQESPQPPQKAKLELHYWFFAAALALAGVFLGWFIPHRSPGQVERSTESNLIKSLFRSSKEPVQVVLSDPSLVLMQTMLGRRFTIDEYSDQSYRRLSSALMGNPQAERLWATLETRQIANIGDVGAATRMQDALSTSSSESPIRVRSAQTMHTRDFRTGNFIILGDSFSDPWAQIFNENQFNFQFERSPSLGQPVIRNTKPHAGEQSVYPENASDNQDYARVVLVPNLTNTGQVLLIAGEAMESTEAAADFCLDSASTQVLLHALGVSNGGKIPFFEAVLHTSTEGGAGIGGKLVSVRIFHPAV